MSFPSSLSLSTHVSPPSTLFSTKLINNVTRNTARLIFLFLKVRKISRALHHAMRSGWGAIRDPMRTIGKLSHTCRISHQFGHTYRRHQQSTMTMSDPLAVGHCCCCYTLAVVCLCRIHWVIHFNRLKLCPSNRPLPCLLSVEPFPPPVVWLAASTGCTKASANDPSCNLIGDIIWNNETLPSKRYWKMMEKCISLGRNETYWRWNDPLATIFRNIYFGFAFLSHDRWIGGSLRKEMISLFD